jgi:Transposase, Mutator family
LFCDAQYLKLRPDDAPAEGVLVAWGVTLEGRRVLLGLAPGSRESYENWLAFGRDVVDRRLRSPGLIVADGAPGLWKAARELWPAAEEQRCTVHALRNLTGKLPERHHRELKRAGGASSTTPPVPPTRAAALRRSSPTTGPRIRDGRSGPYEMYLLHGRSLLRLDGPRHPSRCQRQRKRRENRHLNFYKRRDNFQDLRLQRLALRAGSIGKDSRLAEL